MKELSIEEKAKAYDEAIINGSRLWECGLITRETYEDIFPELKESEDERIRKELISHFKETIDNIRSEEIIPRNAKILVGKMQKWIIWLEKQGEQKPQGKTALEAAKEKKVDNQNCVKLADKVKPKFKVGDWVVFNNKHQSIYQVEKIEDWHYILRHTHGGTFRICVLHDENLRLWTINDAKDGDVLATDTWIFIFKRYQDKSVYYHCAVSTFNDFSMSDTGEFDSNYVHPATKEQRDLLFQKMKEVGYEWEKKVLNFHKEY